MFGKDGKLWLTQQQNSPNSILPGLFVMDDPENDTSFKNVTTNEYRNLATKPSGIDVSDDGHIYISQNGTGLVKIQYSEYPNIVLSNSCIEVYADPISNIYTVSGDLSSYNVDIIYPGGAVYKNLDDDINDSGTAVSINLDDLPSGNFLVRVVDPTNNDLLVEKIIK